MGHELLPLPRPPRPDLSYEADAEAMYWTTKHSYYQILKAGMISPSEWRDGLRWERRRGWVVSTSGKQVFEEKEGPFWFAFSSDYLIETLERR